MRPTAVLIVVILSAAPMVGTAAEGPLVRRDVAGFGILSMRTLRLRNATIIGDCSVGVNCGSPSANSVCGRISSLGSTFGGQLIGDVAVMDQRSRGVQVFANAGERVLGLVTRPGSGANGTTPFQTPILPDVDGDGSPSCGTIGGNCIPDFGDLERACGMPEVFPACDLARTLRVNLDQDCDPFDTVPGNARCDLPPGTYGRLSVSNGGRIQLTGGDYAFCGVTMGDRIALTAAAPSTLFVSEDFTVNSDARVGTRCGDLSIFLRGRAFTIGRAKLSRRPVKSSARSKPFVQSRFTANVCAPEALVRIGPGVLLVGQIIGGDFIDVGGSLTLACCGTSTVATP
ncbi:MAG TPA: hypothetical protein VGR62_03375 [Candidatus Binatia bacterium]|nr:hypothetical protein [Candidatus Binatia bacterium]